MPVFAQPVATFSLFTICRLAHEHVADIHALMLDVVSRLPDRGLFAADEEPYFHDQLDHGGEIYGVYNNGKLEAYTVLAYPGMAAGNLGREFGVPEDEIARVWVLDATIVHESVRGHGLQRYFHQLREQRALIRGGLYLYSTVHPDNAVSKRNLEVAGLELQFTRPMYGGNPRHCYAKRLRG